MSDPKLIVEGIRTFLRSNGVGVDGHLVSLAAEYAAMSREANARLVRCAEFLHEGLLGEAVDFANARPPLLEMVTALDFREFPDWDRACGTFALARPTRITKEMAIELRQAMKRHEPLRELLAQQRYLALSHATLLDRLNVLRQLIVIDSESAIWKRDAQTLERTRFAEIHHEAADAVRGQDIAALDQLLTELRTSPWQAPPPADLLDTVSRAWTSYHQSTAISRLQALVPRVREAYGAMSYDECRQVFAEWGRIVKDAKLVVPQELRKEIVPLAHWIDAQEDRLERDRQFKAGCESLRFALDAHTSPHELKALYQRIISFDLDIPADLASDYRRAMDAARQEEQTEKRRQYALAAALVGAIVLALSALAFAIFTTGKH